MVNSDLTFTQCLLYAYQDQGGKLLYGSEYSEC